MQRNDSLYRLLITAILLAVGMVLPFLTGQLQSFGQLISPLHIPVFICGLTCGWGWGAALGFILPILRGLIFGMPPFPAVGLPMAFEMLFYGLVTGALYPLLRKVFRDKHIVAMLIAMVAAMILGRCAGGVTRAIMMGMQGQSYAFSAFFASYFTGTVVGAVIHIIVCPLIVLALEKARLSPLAKTSASA